MALITLTGKVIKIPERKQKDNGMPYASFSFVEEVFKNGQKNPVYYTCTAYAETMESVLKLKNQSSICLVGEFTASIRTGQNGNPEISRFITVKSFSYNPYFTGGKKGDGQNTQNNYQGQNQQGYQNQGYQGSQQYQNQQQGYQNQQYQNQQYQNQQQGYQGNLPPQNNYSGGN